MHDGYLAVSVRVSGLPRLERSGLVRVSLASGMHIYFGATLLGLRGNGQVFVIKRKMNGAAGED